MDMSGTVPGVGFIDQTNGYDFLLEMVRENAHKVRTRIYFPGLDEDAELTQLMGYLDNKWPDYGPDMAKIVGIGEWSVGRSLFNEQPLGDAARLAQRRIAERGWTYHQHIHSPAEIDAHLDVWEELADEYDIAAMRWTPGSPERNHTRTRRARRRHGAGPGSTWPALPQRNSRQAAPVEDHPE